MELENILNSNLTIEDMKKISKFIIEEEAKRENIEIEVLPITLVEWYKQDDFIKDFKLYNFSNKIISLSKPLINFGTNYLKSKKIYIFLNRFKNNNLSLYSLFNLIFTSYHEFAHSCQVFNHDKYSLDEYYIIFLENYLIKSNYTFYQKNHKNFFTEIDADYCAINKTESFFKKYPKLYKENKKIIEKTKKTSEINYINYDFQFIFDSFFKKYTKDVNKGNIDFDNNFFDFLFEKESNKFKSIKEIMATSQNNKQFIFQIFVSKPFISQLDITKLDNYELDIFMYALLFSLDNEIIKHEKNKLFIKDINTVSQYNLVSSYLQINEQRIDYLNKILNEFYNINYLKDKNIYLIDKKIYKKIKKT